MSPVPVYWWPISIQKTSPERSYWELEVDSVDSLSLKTNLQWSLLWPFPRPSLETLECGRHIPSFLETLREDTVSNICSYTTVKYILLLFFLTVHDRKKKISCGKIRLKTVKTAKKPLKSMKFSANFTKVEELMTECQSNFKQFIFPCGNF